MSKLSPEEIPNELRELRGEQTQAQIAEKVGISRSLWSALENRQRPLTIALTNRMQKRLKLTDDQVKNIRLWWGESHLVLPHDKKQQNNAAA